VVSRQSWRHIVNQDALQVNIFYDECAQADYYYYEARANDDGSGANDNDDKARANDNDDKACANDNDDQPCGRRCILIMSRRRDLTVVTDAPARMFDPSSRSDTTAMTPNNSERPPQIKSEGNRGSEAANETGLREAFLSHGGELFGFARRSLSSTERAEDAVQETFARAWRSRARFDSSIGSLRTWLFAIERRVILDLSSQEIKHQTVPLESANEPVSEDHVERAILGWQMESALARLDPEHRLIVVEMYFNGRSGREVAELYAIPEGTVRSRAFYALRMLRLLLEEGGLDQ